MKDVCRHRRSFASGCASPLWTAVLLSALLGGTVRAAPRGGGPGPKPPEDLTSLSLQALLDVEVVSASRREEKLGDTAAAVYVITREDIRRSGAATLPDALRLAPGVFVAQLDSSRWMVSIRGFSSRFSDKLLVMIDGRSVYSPVFAGVYWDLQDVFLEDVERIEVIRGPGGSVWGSNAVNGVINVITRNSRDTQGAVVDVRAGTQDGVAGGVRQGGAIGEKATYRVFGKGFSRRGDPKASGSRENDGWRMAHAGMRVDWQPDEDNDIMVEAEGYNGAADVENSVSGSDASVTTVASVSDTAAAYALARWTRRHGQRLESRLQVYFDHLQRNDLTLEHTRVDTTDFDFQSTFDASPRDRLMWGAGARFIGDRLVAGQGAAFEPEARRTGLQSVFVQQEHWLAPDRAALTVGAKLEHNSFTGWQLQPDISLLLKPVDKQTLWLSVSRAARLPTRATSDVRFQIPTAGAVTRGVGNPDLKAESLWAYEAGYRVQLGSRWSVDVSGFYQEYSNLATFLVGDPILGGDQVILPATYANDEKGEAYGLESVVGWRPRRKLRLLASYSLLRLDLRPTRAGVLPSSLRNEITTPAHIAWFQARSDLSSTLHLDLTYRYNAAFLNGLQPALHQADVRLAWTPLERIELEVGGRDLFDPQHSETISFEGDVAREIGRNFYVGLRWGL